MGEWSELYLAVRMFRAAGEMGLARAVGLACSEFGEGVVLRAEGLDPVGSEGADQVVDFGRVGDVQYGGATTATPPASWMGEVAWAASGQNLTGVGSPYEAPERPDLVTPPELEEATRQVLALRP